jgi:hypothetical protein
MILESKKLLCCFSFLICFSFSFNRDEPGTGLLSDFAAIVSLHPVLREVPPRITRFAGIVFHATGPFGPCVEVEEEKFYGRARR